MKLILRSTLAAAAVSVAMPTLAFTPIDFQWYADVGRVFDAPPATLVPVPTRAGYIWTAGHIENRPGDRQVLVPGHFVRDDYFEQVERYSPAYGVATVTVYDSQGNLITALAR
jgi:hypothetical protein